MPLAYRVAVTPAMTARARCDEAGGGGGGIGRGARGDADLPDPMLASAIRAR